MFISLRLRLIVIGILAAGSCFVMWRNQRATQGPDRAGHPVNLGLDLQGGMHLALELDQSERVSADPARDIELALTVLRKRIDEFGVLEPLIQKVGTERIIVELPGLRDPERAKEIVRRNAFLEFRITDKTRALERALPAMDRALRDLGISADPGAATRPAPVQELLGDEPTETEMSLATGGLLTRLIHPSDLPEAGSMPGEYVVSETAWRQVDSLLRLPAIRRLWPRGVDFKWAAEPVRETTGQYRHLYALDERAIITGSSLVDAQAQLDPLTVGAEVHFELDRRGGRRFAQETARHIGDYMAILLDGEVQGRPPVIQSRIDRHGRIQLGGRSLEEAQDLALTLRAGALPTPLTIVEERQVGPSLGQDSIRGGILAGVVGTAVVILVISGYYALSGALAVVALSFYALFTLGALSALGATLTLPGLAGFVLSIGIAVDANVLIFERIREELAAGKTVRLAVDEGFKHAMPAIVDSNLTTVLTALFLFQFGTGPVKGFAVTLIVGIFASMVTAVFVTRTFYLLWLRAKPAMQRLSVGALRLFKEAAYDFIGVRRKAYIVTGMVLATGAGFLALRGVNYGVEFTGGTLLQVRTADDLSDGALRDGLRAQGLEGAEIQRFGNANEFIIRVGLSGEPSDVDNLEGAAAAVGTALEQVVGRGAFEIQRTEAVGPKVGAELRRQAAAAIVLSFIAVLAYLAYRFEWRFGLGAVAATAHDILATIAFIAVLGLEVGLVVVAAILTVVGYSLNDTIVIFDRVRENLRRRRNEEFVPILNRSVNETLPRTVLTGGTALATLVALASFGGEVVRPFALVMFFGILTGTFSSIFIASPLLLWIERKWPGGHARGVRSQGRVTAPAQNHPARRM